MGFNTAVIVRNDFLRDIKSDPEFGWKLYGAVSSAWLNISDHQSFRCLPSQHADTAQIIVIAANSIRALGFGSWKHTDEELLRTLADQMGFRVSRKPSKERQS